MYQAITTIRDRLDIREKKLLCERSKIKLQELRKGLTMREKMVV